jgi:hypothetical protein
MALVASAFAAPALAVFAPVLGLLASTVSLVVVWAFALAIRSLFALTPANRPATGT